MNLKRFSHNTTFSVQLPYIAGHSLNNYLIRTLNFSLVFVICVILFTNYVTLPVSTVLLKKLCKLGKMNDKSNMPSCAQPKI